ncbi:Trk-type K+ transport system, membrane component [Hoeflea sp. IMCC20628]|uniref:TrkH family potassium uptake protein n=1 Tax=Hoeflea sp. IMCC20628 TaxID=1620421 RepID=UPI00063AEFD0|nr:TrkH family potassium uptake protein [Hoeflea sp. IMCC20628]AKI00438.1 Trk-type K+ transport system, membrane component [Hoeflea sp. IMCC20628]
MHAQTIRSAVFIASMAGLYLSAAMLVPAAVDFYFDNPDWRVFTVSSFSVGAVCLAAATATRGANAPFSRRLGFLLVNLLWVVLSVTGAIPFYLASLGLDMADALFESVSAVTTTGATVISGLDSAPPGLLLWRSLLQWIGGIGIVALGLLVLPFLKVGGFTVFKMESSDTSEKPFERFAVFVRAFFAIYIGLTLTCAILYKILGMSGFDAINHAMTTMATGGFSTHDASFGAFQSAGLVWTATIFMAIAGLPFSVLILFAVRGRLDALRDPQIYAYAGLVVVLSLTIALSLRLSQDESFGMALTHSAFNVVSVITTTGFASTDYTKWGPLAVVILFMATFLGGCSGSTAGGIKAYRLVIIYGSIRAGLMRLIYPNSVRPVRYGSVAVEPDMQRTVFLFVCAYVGIWALGSIALAATGLDVETAISGSITALANVGPGIGPVIGPAGNFSSLGDPAKMILVFLMLLGRLEILAVLVLLLPAFWRE